MKEIYDFFKTIKLELVLFVALVVVSIFTGINLGFMILVLVLVATTGIVRRGGHGRTAFFLRSAVVIVFGVALITVYFPRSSSKGVHSLAHTDQIISSNLPDKTQVEATDLWDMSKDSQGQRFLVKYRKLIEKGKTKEAYILLKEFQEQWDMEGIAASVKAMEDSIARAKDARLTFVKDSVAQSKIVAGKVVILEKGVHIITLKAGEKSPQIIADGAFCTDSVDDQYQLYFSGLPKPISALTAKSWPKIRVFYIEAFKNEVITITIS